MVEILVKGKAMKIFRMIFAALLLVPTIAQAQGGAMNGTIGKPASINAVQVAGQDPSFNLKALKVDGTGALVTSSSTYAVPSSAAANAIAPVAAGFVGAAYVLCVSACNMYGLNVVAGASAGYVMLFNATSTPADGAVTPVYCMPIAANQGMEASWRNIPKRMTVGATLVFSTTGCFTKTASGTAFLSADFQ